MKVEEVQARKRELVKRREQCVLEMQALTGAIADCEYWVSRLMNPPKEEEPSDEAA